ncbi:beta-ketoacyl-ACP synthase III [Halonatronum saccharophilum]|uniref:beta-ketoacyl-ACP synthase III n=1 Tax=Halonatronum saccharophilum TaxID=150060 RepID=UPI000481FFBD|nr:beta-ketoacyl-ACP synthase III [Halonatronum saccharophilum]
MHRRVKILGSGAFLPSRKVRSEELAKELGLEKDRIEKMSGVIERHYVEEETTSQMGAFAAQEALKNANLKFSDIDCIISTGGTIEQIVPATAPLIKEAMGEVESKIPCFDINSTCLSFITGLDVISYLIEAGRYEKVLVVSSEIASKFLNSKQLESYALFGDGAGAAVIGKSESGDDSKIIASKMETYIKGVHLTEIRGGATGLHARNYSNETKEEFLFDMDGPKVFKLARKYANDFIEQLLTEAGLKKEDIDLLVGHQASGSAMKLVYNKLLGFPSHKVMNILSNHGNVVAASIPLALNEAIKQKKLRRGDKVLFFGAGAGLSFGGIILEY